MSRLISELKRRNVFRVGAAYALVAWLIAQAGDLAADNLGFPDWFMPMLLVGLVLGFPIAVFFAWAFELTPGGVKKTADVDADISIAPSTGQRLNRFIIGALVLAVGFLVFDRVSPPVVELPTEIEDAADAKSVPAKSIAVLPFSNLSDDSSTNSFVAGLHDDLLTQLSKINDLKVISRTSVLQYAGTLRNMKDTAAELGVATIMEGGVQRVGDRVRLNVQLIDSATDEHIWAETYDRVLTTENVFDIQSEITRHIAVALEAALTPSEEARLTDRPTDNLAAYEAYLNAKLLNQSFAGSGEDALEEAIAFAKLAVELDPGFVEAWAVLAEVYLGRFWYSSRDPVYANAAWAAIGRARTLQPDATDVGLMLGLYHYWVNFDYAAALFEIERVLAVEPGNERAWAIQGWVLRRAGRWDEALESMKRAALLNPNSIENLFEVAGTLKPMNRFSEAVAWLADARKRIPDEKQLDVAVADLILAMSGNPESLVSAYRKQAAESDQNQYARLTHVLVEARHADSQRALDYLDRWAPGTVDVQYEFWPEDLLRAYVYHSMGRVADARSFAAKSLPVIANAKRFEPNEPDIAKAEAFAMALMGRADEAVASANRLRKLYPRSHDAWGGSDYLFGVIEAMAVAGNNALALEWLDDYLSDRAAQNTLIGIKAMRSFSKLIEDPGFAILVDKYGLVPKDESPGIN